MTAPSVGEAVGVDGWLGNWVSAHVRDDLVSLRTWTNFADLVTEYAALVIGVDMPIGLTEGPRPADAAARDWLRRHQGPWQSIFLAPTVAMVDAWSADHSHRNAMDARPAGVPGTSIQAWNLIPKIVEVGEALTLRPDVRVVEVHPECSFRKIDASIGMASKKSAVGVGRRLRALQHAFTVPDLVDAPDKVPVDDMLDAIAAGWSAARYARDEAEFLPAGATEGPRIVV